MCKGSTPHSLALGLVHGVRKDVTPLVKYCCQHLSVTIKSQFDKGAMKKLLAMAFLVCWPGACIIPAFVSVALAKELTGVPIHGPLTH